MAEVQKLGRNISLTITVEQFDVVESQGAESGSQSNQVFKSLKARISLVQSGQHVVYTLRVIHEGKSWKLRKRFSEVAALHDIIHKRLSFIPDLPAKTVVRQFSPEYLESRKQALTAYFEVISKRRDVLNCTEVQNFLAMSENVAAFRQPSACEPIQAAEIHEAAFGISDFAFDAMNGLLLIGAADSSWTSRMDTKITNIKLPWEPTAPNLPMAQMSLWKQSATDLRFDMHFTCRYTTLLSCVVLSNARDPGFCLCGLHDGTVGFHAIRGEPGVRNAGATLPLLRHTAAIVALETDENEQWVFSASKDNAVIVYDAKRQMIQCEVVTPAPTTKMKYVSKQQRLFTALQTGRIVVWDTSSFPIQQLATIPEGVETGPRITAIDHDLASSTLFTASKEGFALWAVKTSNMGCWGRSIGQIRAVSHTPQCMTYAPSSREIFAGFNSGAVVVFDIEKGEASYAFQAHKEEVSSMLWLDAPRRLLTASKDRTVKIWDFPSLRNTPLEDEAVFSQPIAQAPAISTAPNMAPPGSSRFSNPFSRGSGGGDPLLGRQTGDDNRDATIIRTTPDVAAGANGTDPLSRGAVQQSGTVSSRSSSYVATATATPVPQRSTASEGGFSHPLGVGASTTTTRPAQSSTVKVAGAPTGALVREDSDNDLLGWDQ